MCDPILFLGIPVRRGRRNLGCTDESSIRSREYDQCLAVLPFSTAPGGIPLLRWCGGERAAAGCDVKAASELRACAGLIGSLHLSGSELRPGRRRRPERPYVAGYEI